MSDPPAEYGPPSEGLDKAQLLIRCLAGATALSFLGIVLLLALPIRRQDWRACRTIIAEASLSTLAIFPSGTPERSPEIAHSAVARRYAPSLPRADFGAAALLGDRGRARSPNHDRPQSTFGEAVVR